LLDLKDVMAYAAICCLPLTSAVLATLIPSAPQTPARGFSVVKAASTAGKDRP